jgi:hypothetical protein
LIVAKRTGVLVVAGSQAGLAAGASSWLELVGHDDLLARGMNAALAVRGDYAYVGSRTDGSHQDAGVLVVNVSSPAHRKVVGQIGPPDEGNQSETSRECGSGRSSIS